MELTQEMIDFQDRQYYEKLIAVCARLLSEKKTPKQIEDENLIGLVVREHTQILLSVRYIQEPNELDISIHCPMVSSHDTLNLYKIFGVGSNEDGYMTLRRLMVRQKEAGTIDFARNKVTGIFCKIPMTLQIVADLNSPKHTPNMLAGLIAHELGHAFTTLQYISEFVQEVALVGRAARNITGVRDPKVRRVEFERLQDAIGVSINIDDVLTTNTDEDTKNRLMQYVISKRLTEPSVRTNDWVYCWRNAERLADAYAVRLGAGADLARALLMFDIDPATLKVSKQSLDLFQATMCVLGVTATGVMNVIVPPTIIATLTALFAVTVHESRKPQERLIYDEPEKRIQTLRLGLIEHLKNRSLNAKEIAATRKDIEVIDECLKFVRDPAYTSFYQNLKLLVNPYHRMSRSQTEMNGLLEKMFSNNLYLAAAKLKEL